jgi:uncharacterized protein (TIGR03437 family)
MNNATIQRLVFRRKVWVLSLIFVWVCFVAATMPTRPRVQGAELDASSTLMLDLAGADGPVVALAGEGDYVYAGGSFSTIGGVSARGVARFNVKTGQWTTLGTGTTSTGNGVAGFVEDIAISGNDVYIVGGFSRVYQNATTSVSANNAAKWNSTTGLWAALGGGSGLSANGVNQRVDKVLVSGSNVYLCGAFSAAYNAANNSVFANGVVRWNGSVWAALGNGSAANGNGIAGGQAWVHALALIGNKLYVAGSFTKAINNTGNEVSANYVACWNTVTNTWAALGTGSGEKANGTDFSVSALAVSGTDLIVGGGFFNVYNNAANVVRVNAVARYNGTTWTVFNGVAGANKNGVSGYLNTIHASGNNVYLGGAFSQGNNGDGTGVSANDIVRWNGTGWQALGASTGSTGNGVDAQVQAILVLGNYVYVGGTFQKAYNSNSSSVDAPRLGRWNGSSWSDVVGAAMNNLACASAASYGNTRFASEQIVSAFGTGLATGTQVANGLPLPTTLAGTTVRVRDSAGTERLAPLFFVSAGQINYQLPAGTMNGNATITVTAGDGSLSGGALPVQTVAPGLFSANANGQGVAAAVVLRVKANGAQSYEPAVRFDTATNKFVAVPIDLGPATDQVFLILYGTGIHKRSSLTNVTAQIGGTTAEVLYAGKQGTLVGVDQVNLRLARTLIGRGDVDVALMVDGVAANVVRINIK